MATEKDYFVFISYSDKDSDWAIWLRRKLRKFHLPASFNGERDVRRNLREVFRDRDELKAGPDWEEQVNKALEHTHNLIVICSPNSKTSPNVDKEVKRFIALEEDNENHIFPFIVEGDKPEDCFPSALEHSKLAGDVKKDGGRDVAFFKIVAGMLGIDLEKLRQEDQREQRRKRWIWTGISLLLAMIGFGIGAYFIKQNGVIESQNNQLQKLVKNLKEENNTISFLQSDQKQYYYMGQLRGSGCYDISLMEFDYHPYEPIVAFIDDSGVWLHYLNSDREVCLPTYYKGEQIIDLCELRFSNDGRFVKANGRTITNWDFADYIWCIEDCKLIGQCSLDLFNERKNKNCRLSEIMNYECRNGKLYLYNTIEHKTICSTDFDSDDNKPDCIYNPKYDEILFLSKNRAALYDNTKEDFVMFFKGYNNPDQFEFSESGEYLRIEKNIYGKTTKIDTIRNLKYSVYPIADFPYLDEKRNGVCDTLNHATLDVNEESIIYKSGSHIKKIKVVYDYTSGNMQEHLVDALFAGPNKVIAIVAQGKFRIYSTHSWSLLGTLINYIWSGVDNECSVGNEGELGHVESFISDAKYINDRLYVLSSGGVLRVYNINKCRLEEVIVLPLERKGERHLGALDKSLISDDGTRIHYSFANQDIYYDCELPHKE